MFPEPVREFFRYRNAQKYRVDSGLLNEENVLYPV
jgi:hypothetical protein